MNINLSAFKYLFQVFLITISINAFAQSGDRTLTDSLLNKLSVGKQDTNKVNLLMETAKSYNVLNKPDSVSFYLQQALILSTQLKWDIGIAKVNNSFGRFYFTKGNYAKAKNYLSIATNLSLKTENYDLINQAGGDLGQVMAAQKRLPEFISYLKILAERFKKAGRNKKLAYIYILIADFNQEQLNYGGAMEYYNKALALEEVSHEKFLTNHLLGIAYMYITLHNTDKARAMLQKARTSFIKTGDQHALSAVYLALAECDNTDHNYPAAIVNFNKVVEITEKGKIYSNLTSAENSIAWDYHLLKDYEKSYLHSLRAISFAKPGSLSMVYALSTLGTIYREAPDAVIIKAGIKPGLQYEKSVSLLLQGLKYGKDHDDYVLYSDSYNELSQTYEKMHRYADALKAYKTYIVLKDSTTSLINEKAVLLKEAQTNFSFKENSLNYKQAITNAALTQRKTQSYFYMGGIAALLLLSLFIALNYNNQRKLNKLLAKANEQITTANHELSEQREEITSQRDQMATTLTDLRAAQQQLIQSEKMASLGELTAGIAHEIQNPLNFVNNFSEVSVELIAEMNEDLEKGNIAEAKDIAEDVMENLEKIRHHGKRAESIVKGMLEHSRASTGVKEPTDLNSLADEYLRLAYNGLRAKDKSFNATLTIFFDQNLPSVNLIQQDIGRALLNLFNNAFYAIRKKAETEGPDYKPEVNLTTAVKNNMIFISVRDNGTGMPDAIRDKIMQPFFTTKPTGQGTGLGLSLAYDIIVKGHGGNLTVNSVEGQFTQMDILIPVG
jgi:two-component system NtrC family sensor kinase